MFYKYLCSPRLIADRMTDQVEMACIRPMDRALRDCVPDRCIGGPSPKPETLDASLHPSPSSFIKSTSLAQCLDKSFMRHEDLFWCCITRFR